MDGGVQKLVLWIEGEVAEPDLKMQVRDNAGIVRVPRFAGETEGLPLTDPVPAPDLQSGKVGIAGDQTVRVR